MARYVASARTTGTPTNLLPAMSLYASADKNLTVVEVGLRATTAVSNSWRLARLTTQGTPGAAITPCAFDSTAGAAFGTPFQTHAVGPTISDPFWRVLIPAQIGAGEQYFTYKLPIIVEAGTANGIGIVCHGASAVAIDAYFVWDEA